MKRNLAIILVLLFTSTICSQEGTKLYKDLKTGMSVKAARK